MRPPLALGEGQAGIAMRAIAEYGEVDLENRDAFEHATGHFERWERFGGVGRPEGVYRSGVQAGVAPPLELRDAVVTEQTTPVDLADEKCIR